MAESEFVVGGFIFGTLADADLAREEEKRVKYLEGNLNLEEPEGVLQIFQKMLDNRIFVTPIGHVFLMRVQSYLRQAGIAEERIPGIPLYTVYSSRMSALPKNSRTRVEPKKGPDIKKRLMMSILLNCGLVLLVAVMFVIALKADTPNILNYKHALENTYAQWDEELKEREAAVREKERELHINVEEDLSPDARPSFGTAQ